MSHHELSERIKNSPEYTELVSKRSRFAWTLAAIVLVVYYGFILLIAFEPKFLATPISEGAVTTIGFPIGVGVILSAIVLTGLYVYRANTEFDSLTKHLIEGRK